MDFTQVNEMLDEIINDRSVPRNIKEKIENIKKELGNEKEEPVVRINTILPMLDEVSNDANIPVYIRTNIWTIVSMLEIMSREA
jgi:hypothetical protein